MKGLTQYINEALDYDSNDYEQIKVKNKNEVSKLKFDPKKFGYVVVFDDVSNESYFSVDKNGKYYASDDVTKAYELYTKEDVLEIFSEIEKVSKGKRIEFFKVNAL